ncbi:phosphotriesterase [Novosphingobium endophyticum]|uniref:Phosphotriesterase n=1 Tax=Novosphingobium endophyticum TaxID=1955250 RepID=A0A916TT13_9SPHN|nr:hypothetical protein [Novosphingobium endophyticum]GGC02825.1 phosphotriesterase [Novosphingobium endophyticum]
MAQVNTLTGAVPPGELGVTLMHEHVTLQMAGATSDTLVPAPSRAEIIARSVDWLSELKSRGIATIVDPAPGDMGRDLELSAEVSARSGVRIVAATGLFNQAFGGAPYWNGKLLYLRALNRVGDFRKYVADMFINEIRNGVGPERIRCGIIKVASSASAITDYEAEILAAAAIASNETGCPITTHSDDGLLGREQQAALLGHGVPPNRIVIGHSCNTADHGYHRAVVEAGSYIGFDRFGYELAGSDVGRMDALVRLMRSGATECIVISNDACFCWAQNEEPAALREMLAAEYEKRWNPLRISDVIIPALKARGVSDAEIHTLMVENPRRYFSDAPPNSGARE